MVLGFGECEVYTLFHVRKSCDILTFIFLVVVCLIAEISVVQQAFFEPEGW